MVQLSVRVEASLREQLRRAAARDGRSLQDFVVNALTAALERRAQEDQSRLGAARAALAEALDSGSYREYVASIDDPDLRTE